MKNKQQPIIIIATLLYLVLLTGIVTATTTQVNSGTIKALDMVTLFDTYNWAGIKVINDGTPLSEGTSSFTNILINNPGIIEASFPGYNLKGEEYYYMATLSPSFNLLNVKNVTPSDLDSEGLFRSSQFPQFYNPSYDKVSDNPQETFLGNLTNITLGGENFTAFHVILNKNVNYYVLKYNSTVGMTPLFLSNFEDQTCYNNTGCVSEFLIPISDNNYYFYLVGKYESYDYDIYIDGVQTSTFAQTALPYNVTVRVKNIYSGQPTSNVSVLIGESAGQNLFVPYSLTGYISQAYTVGKTNSQGMETFLIAPTVYPSISNYSIYVGVLRNDYRISREELHVLSKDALITQKKVFSPSRLQDNAVASVNAMNQIASFLYTWSSQRTQALKDSIVYDVGNHQFKTYNLQLSSTVENPIIVKTGAPNVFTVSVSNTGSTNPNDYTARVKEQNGYLIMNPYTDDTPLTKTMRNHLQTVAMNQEFIITPTSLGFIQSNVSIDIMDPSGKVIATYQIPVDNSLNIDPAVPTSFYNNDLLKTIVNAMNQILNSLYNSLN